MNSLTELIHYRAHLNDLENVVPFLIIGLLYVGTNPSASVALFFFRLFTASRMLHTVVYAIVVLPQPSRGLSYLGGQIANISMIMNILCAYSHSM